MTSVISVIEIKLGQLPGVIQCVPAPRPPRRDAKRYSNARIELKSHCDGAVPPAVAGATRRITSLARRAGPGRVLRLRRRVSAGPGAHWSEFDVETRVTAVARTP